METKGWWTARRQPRSCLRLEGHWCQTPAMATPAPTGHRWHCHGWNPSSALLCFCKTCHRLSVLGEASRWPGTCCLLGAQGQWVWGFLAAVVDDVSPIRSRAASPNMAVEKCSHKITVICAWGKAPNTWSLRVGGPHSRPQEFLTDPLFFSWGTVCLPYLVHFHGCNPTAMPRSLKSLA